MIEHVEMGEEQEGPFKGKPFIKVICDEKELRNIMNILQRVMQVNSIIDRIKAGVQAARVPR